MRLRRLFLWIRKIFVAANNRPQIKEEAIMADLSMPKVEHLQKLIFLQSKLISNEITYEEFLLIKNTEEEYFNKMQAKQNLK